MASNDNPCRLTNDVAAVISDHGLAVNIDELCDQRLGELGMCSQAAECDVLCPHVLNWGAKSESPRWLEVLHNLSHERERCCTEYHRECDAVAGAQRDLK